MLLAGGTLATASPPAGAEFQLNGGAIQAHAEFLASDLLEGRATGSRGYDLAAAYVSAQFRQLGIKPVGGNDYLQRVPLVEATVVLPGSSLTFKHDSVTDVFEYGNDYLPAANFFTSPVTVTAPVAFAGFGITAPELDYDDFSAVDAQGKIVLILEGAPKKFRPALRDYYAWRDIKYANLIRHGAIAVIEIAALGWNSDSGKTETVDSAWDRAFAMSWVSDLRRINADDEPVDPFAELKVKMRFNAERANSLFVNGHSWDQVMTNAKAGTAQGFALPGAMTLTVTTGLRRTESNNVIGVIAGSDTELRREYVVVTAHLDHLGRGAAVNGDGVYNGMQSNATGVAMLLELAHAIAAMPQRPRRSILFVITTAGSKSGQGIQQFLKSGSIAVNNMVAAISLDTPLPLTRTSDVVGIGSDQSTLGNVVGSLLQTMDMRLSNADIDEGSLAGVGLAPFVQAGIPIIELHSGNHARSARVDMRNLKHDYLQNHFNQPSDDANNAAMDVEAARELDTVIGQLLLSIANDSARPVWYRSSVIHNKVRR